MNDPFKQHIEEHAKFERTINENLTIIIGQNWRTEEKLNLFAERTTNRLERLDERITEAHKDITETELAVKDIKATMATKDDIARLEELLKQLIHQKSDK